MFPSKNHIKMSGKMIVCPVVCIYRSDDKMINGQNPVGGSD